MSADVRGTLKIDPDARVGFESMRMDVRLRAAPGTTSVRLLERLRLGAERRCVTLDTLAAACGSRRNTRSRPAEHARSAARPPEASLV